MAQKIVVVCTSTFAYGDKENFREYEYPELNKYLDEGYSVRTITPVIKSDGTTTFSIIFHLYR